MNMMDKKEKNIEMGKKLIYGLEKSYEKLVAFKRYKNTPLIVSKNGKIIEIPPDEIPPTTKYLY